MKKIISGIQQIGVGTPNEEKAFDWYRKNLGMDICVFQDTAEANLMTNYTGDKVQSRSATLAMNMQGGGGLEVWQYTSRDTQPASFDIKVGDLGVFGTRIKCKDVPNTFEFLQSQDVNIITDIKEDPSGAPHFFVKDPHGLIFQIVSGNSWFSNGKYHTGGIAGCMIGVSDIDHSLSLYRDILEYDQVEYDETGTFDDLAPLNGGSQKIRRVLLSHRKPRKGSFSQLLGPSKIELVEVQNREPRKIFRDRYWGDLGFIHLCFDIKGMDQLKQECEEKGFEFTVDSKNSFDMGEAAGRFSYIEDPDGTLIEFVETHKLPILKSVGWYMDVRNKAPEKPIPKWMLQFLRLSRVR
ncbi:VOC family protein [Fodinibius halophilus]|uniref:VOC family protein n=1 Tax=Fodinibius halophilus TaxID=1736908 RepID=A0A6M1T658_9BACT|nr:VOC family protein [Fodinibius halophilus]NGP86744.1 VOC family protein [Fodinibius halophilus]